METHPHITTKLSWWGTWWDFHMLRNFLILRLFFRGALKTRSSVFSSWKQSKIFPRTSISLYFSSWTGTRTTWFRANLLNDCKNSSWTKRWRRKKQSDERRNWERGLRQVLSFDYLTYVLFLKKSFIRFTQNLGTSTRIRWIMSHLDDIR